MEPTDIKIQDALQYANEWIAHLATRPDAELVRRLDTNAFQYEIAYKNKDVKLCELMDVMHRILVEARMHKDEHQIPDEISEISLEVSQMEHVIAQDEVRQEVLESLHPQRISKPKIQEDNSSQMTLF